MFLPYLACSSLLPAPADHDPDTGGVHYCACGRPIGDGDHASGRRRCWSCQPPKVPRPRIGG